MAGIEQNFLMAALGGILPALFWLWFWLREDRRHPEPKGLILEAFIMGGVGTFFALALEKYAQGFALTGLALGISWATIEEIIKYLAAYLGAFIHKDFDEPVDAMIYLTISALGFAALENTLFLINALAKVGDNAAFITGNIRFIGASLLHLVSSSVVGAAIGLTFYKSPRARGLATFIGLILAIGLHTLFNFFIMYEDGKHTFSVLLTLWLAVIITFLMFERVKRVKSS